MCQSVFYTFKTLTLARCNNNIIAFLTAGLRKKSSISNVIYKSADFKNCAPSFKNTIVINRTNYYIVYKLTAIQSVNQSVYNVHTRLYIVYTRVLNVVLRPYLVCVHYSQRRQLSSGSAVLSNLCTKFRSTRTRVPWYTYTY